MELSKDQAEKMEETTVDEGSLMWMNKNYIQRNNLTHLDQSHHEVRRQVNVTFSVMIHAVATRKASGPLKGKM